MPPSPDSPTLRDGDLELRRLVASDRDGLFAACHDPEILRCTALPDPFTMANRAGFVEEGVLRLRLPCRGSYRDVRCFSLLRGEEAETGA